MTAWVTALSATIATVASASAALAWARRWQREDEPNDVVLTAVLLFPILASAQVLLLAAASALTASGLVISGLALATAARVTASERAATAPHASAREILAGLALGLATGWLAGHFVIPGPFFSSDDLSYHGPYVAELVGSGQLGLFPQSYHAFYPFGAESFAAFFATLLGSDALSPLVGVYWLAAIAWGVFCIVVGAAGPHVAAIAALVSLASLGAKRSAMTLTSVDLAGPAFVLGALALLCRARNIDTRLAALTGLAAGSAVGVKVSMAVAPLVLLAALWIPGSEATRDKRGRALLVFAACALLAGGGWYLRNLWLTGNPLYPAALGPLDGPMTAEHLARTRLSHWLVGDGSLAHWKLVLAEHFRKTPSSVAAVLGYVALLVMGRRGSDASRWWPCHAALLLALVLYPLQPFSGTDNSATAPLRVSPRFVLLPAFLATALLFRGLPSVRLAIAAALAIAVAPDLVAAAFQGEKLNNAAFNFAALACMGFVAAAPITSELKALVPTVKRAASGCAAGLVFGVILASGSMDARGEARLAAFEHEGIALGRAWQIVRALPPESRIALVGSLSRYEYPAFGRTFASRPLRFFPDLERYRHLSPSSTEAPVTSDAFLASLASEGADHVFVSDDRTGAGARARATLERSGSFARVHESPGISLWRSTRRATR